jgi:hypothetical protein
MGQVEQATHAAIKRIKSGRALRARTSWLVLLAALSAPRVAQAATYTVTNTNNSGVGSLRAALALADNDSATDTITFAPGVTGTIVLASALVPTESVIVTGPGSGVLAISTSRTW